MKPIKSLVLILFSFCGSLWGTESGTLIVTYQTDKMGERLDRIRFGVQGTDYKLKMYPKSKMFVDDPINKTRQVVIENLPVGEYSIIFLVPNTDNYFFEVPTKKVIITPGEVVKLNQMINPKNPESIPYDSKKNGSLVVSYSSDKDDLEEISFQLIYSDGKKITYPKTDDAINTIKNRGMVIVIQDLKPEKYKLIFFKKDQEDFLQLSTQEVHILENVPTTIHRFFN